MPRWTCPACNRSFGRTNQSHVCAPVMPLGDCLDRLPTEWRAACEDVLAHLEGLGEIVVDCAEVGLLVKRSRTFVEMRPRSRWLDLSFLLSRPLDHPRVARSVRATGRRQAHFVRVYSPVDIDETVRGWLTESFFESPP